MAFRRLVAGPYGDRCAEGRGRSSRPAGRHRPRSRPAPEIEQLLKTAHERVRETLGKKRLILDALGKRLIEKEVVDRAALVQLMADTESLRRQEEPQRHA
jgi:hypothetical protein